MTSKKYKLAFKEILDFEGYILCGFQKYENSIEFFLRRTRECGTCPKCNKSKRRLTDRFQRSVRDLDIGNKKSYLNLEVWRIECSCGYRGIEKIKFLDKWERHTTRFAEFVSKLCKIMSIKDASVVARIDWKTAKRIDKEKLQESVKGLDEVNPTQIGIDEIAYEKGHKYITIVRDLEGRVIWIGLNRKKETLDRFFLELGRDKSSKIKVAVMDMWDPYVASVRENTNANIVFDKFHISKKINEALDNIRKKEFAKADKIERIEMKHKRFLILARKDNLSSKKKEELKVLMRQNKILYKAYLLKEQVLDIFSEATEENAIKRFMQWMRNVEKSGLEEFKTAINMINRYFYGIINYFRYRITNAGSEGFNTKINIIKRRAYGFRDIEYFMLKILQSCG
jgi:transposase